MTRDERIRAALRTPKGEALVKSAAKRIGAPPVLDLTTAVKARSCAAALLKNQTASTEEIAAYGAVVTALYPSLPPRDETMDAIFATFRDETIAGQNAIRKTLIRMSEIADEEDGFATSTVFKSTQRKRGKLGGLFV
jgi:hypothetical protein